MKKTTLLFAFLLTFTGCYLFAQPKSPAVLPPIEKVYKYDTITNDPIKTRIYTLENGLKVYLSVYKSAPRVYTSIPVRTGSKNDPADATGLAHYLEHMLFKGTDRYGCKDYVKEKTELRKIDSLYDVYGTIKDTGQRKKIYRQIDSISGVASKYAIANEYDKLMSNLGASGTNAYTWVDQTVYINDIPSNQLKKWLEVEGERFRHPVMRLFHTELEAVYEEKNRSLDDDNSKAGEALFAGLWQKHTYGTQTTIGTIEHLKNPSLKKIKEYFNTYYVPNNMALCLAGDLDPDSTIKWADQYLGGWKSKQVPAFIPPVEEPISAPIVKNVTGPFPESMTMAFRFQGANTQEADLMVMTDMILANGKAGLIDLDLVQKQRVLSAYSYHMIMKDYSAHVFGAEPKEGQKLEELTGILLEEIEKIKKGDFPDWLPSAIITNMILDDIRTNENNAGRVNRFVEAFIYDSPWSHSVDRLKRLSRITKQDIVAFANKHYSNNYVVVYKRTGTDSTIQKVEKPEITPVEVNRNDQSEFLKKIINTEVSDIEPVFLDYEKDLSRSAIKGNIPLLYTPNKESKLFTLYYLLDMGSNHNTKLPVAIEYLPFLGTSKLSPKQMQEELYKLGCNFGVSNSNDQVYVYLSGLTENFEKGVTLFEELLNEAKPEPEALKNLVSNILKKRSDAKLDKNNILWGAMLDYSKYGPRSPFTNILSEQELNMLKVDELVSIVRSLSSYEHRALYYGPMKIEDVSATLSKLHRCPATLKPIPAPKKFEELPTVTNKIFAIDYDMAQVELFLVSKNELYYKSLAPGIRMFNEYFGAGSMSSILFQELRESKALAYSVFAGYAEAKKIDESNYMQAYIGAQADKLPAAMDGLFGLLKAMPESEVAFSSAKKAVLENIRTNRITKTGILFNYEQAKKVGLTYDIRKDVYEKVVDMKLADVKRFHSVHVSNKEYTITVLGNKKLIDQKVLEKYGPVKWLTLEEIFGY